MTQQISPALAEVAREWFSLGLGIAFVLSLLFILFFLVRRQADVGYVGLIFLLTMIFYLIAFSFLVAASTPGIEIKIAVAVVDSLVLLGSKLLTPIFLTYLSDTDGKAFLRIQLEAEKRRRSS